MSKLHPYLLWTILTLPSLGMLYNFFLSQDPDVLSGLVHETGELSARLLIVTMLASPLLLIWRQGAIPRWLKKNRRYLGVAAFGYAALHTVFYVTDKGSLGVILSDATKLYIWTGWIAFIIFVPLAITSADRFVRAMGPAWKNLQRATYFAALFTLLHWGAIQDWDGLRPALMHFGPLAVLEAYRVWYWYLRPRKTQLA